MRNIGRAALIILGVLAVAAVVTAADLDSRGLSSTDLLAPKPPGSNPPPPPDPDVIMQGGDTCADATVISSLPYTDTGTTAGLNDDLQPTTCGFAGGAPDAVYVYTPPVNQVIVVDLCAATTYDSTVYVLEGTCPGPEIACNDDDCGLQSRLGSVAVTAGTSYYIVIDGYSSAAGSYSLDVTEGIPPPGCPPEGTLYGQLPVTPDGSWNAYTSGETPSFNYTVYDNFTSDLFSITDFHWWGLSLFWTGSGWNLCDPAGMTFDITFHPDAGGVPGAAVCTFAGVAPTPVDTGLSYAGFPSYYWEVTGLSPACEPTGATWVGVHSYPNAFGCAMLWSNSTDGDGVGLQYDAVAYTPIEDVAFCITGEIVPVELQTFDVE